jgi:hypothetical protein
MAPQQYTQKSKGAHRIRNTIINGFIDPTSEQLFHQIKIFQYQLCQIKLDEQLKRLILFFSCIKLPIKMAGWKLIKTCFLISLYDHGPKKSLRAEHGEKQAHNREKRK